MSGKQHLTSAQISGFSSLRSQIRPGRSGLPDTFSRKARPIRCGWKPFRANV